MAANGMTDTETLAKELRKPDIRNVEGSPVLLIPDGFRYETLDELLEQPKRKQGTVYLHDTDSFIRFVKREGSLASCNIYAETDYEKSRVLFIAVLNDNEEESPHWRDYRVVYSPRKSVEWELWTANNRKKMSQGDFAQFIEENNKDVASAPGMPTGVQMLEMALNFESKQEVIVKSAIRTQSGTVAFSYTNGEDAATIERMEMFKGFALGLAPFFNGEGFQLNARLKYLHAQSRLTFWYELDRPDVVLQKATQKIINTIKADSGFPLFFGCP